MPTIGEKELKEQIKAREFAPVYCLYGEESYLKQYYVEKLKKAVVGAELTDFNFHQYEGKNTPIKEILLDADMIPLMGGYTLSVIHDYPLDKNKADMDALKAYFKDMSDTCVLVFWFDSIKPDIKDAKWKGILGAFAKAGCAVDMKPRSESELVQQLVRKAKGWGAPLSSSDAHYLIGIVGNDIQSLFSELKKICSYAGNREVTRADIDKLATKSLQTRVFDLSKFILSGQSDRAYALLSSLFLQKEQPLSILAIIASNYVDMYRVKCAKMAGQSEKDVKNYFSYGGREFLLTRAAENCRHISVENLRAALDVLSDTDEKMKSTPFDKNILLEQTVAQLLMLR